MSKREAVSHRRAGAHAKLRGRSPDTAPVRLSVGTIRETRDRLQVLAARDGMKLSALIMEAIHIHLHRLESQGDARLRRKQVCWGCGGTMDAASGGTRRAGRSFGRTTKP